MSRSPASSTEAILPVLRSRALTLAPDTVVGTGIYLESKQVWTALLACVLGPPAVAIGRVLAEWVELLRPSRRLRRPRRRGT